jgi:hypothetical protein
LRGDRRVSANLENARSAPPHIGDVLEDFIRHAGASELMVRANFFDHSKRERSLAIVAEVRGGMKKTAVGQL